MPQKAKGFDFYVRKDISGCWLWTGGISSNGYGKYKDNGFQISAHRYSYQRIHGNVSSAYHLDHICNVKHCVNPNHLQVTTCKQNCRRGKQAKITQIEADQIRDLLRSKLFLQKEIALFYSVDQVTISDILRRKTW